ncbi:MAG: AgmX/PglI C-terminal domain-containing protein [Deltaproteobacteria bacterium]|nr:AgmX/PglI C-terminal domain-containing protein [Deltaproteobacteria bacterium]
MSKRPSWAGLTLCGLAGVTLASSGCQATAPAPVPPPQVTVVVPPLEVPEGKPIVHRTSRAPMTLTASDGTGLRLASIESRTLVEGPLAFTELHLAFDNPESRTLEGRFNIALPPRATVARFAMKLEDGWQEAEVVEKTAAREAYEDFLHRKQDPALLEQAAGNEFSARVFPIFARARKEIIISYAQELTSGATPVVPLQGLTQIEQLDVSVRQAKADRPFQALKKEKYTPSGDFGFDPTVLKPGPGVRSGNLAIVRVQPKLDATPEPLGSAVILIDTSASRALGLEEELRVLDGLVRKVGIDGGAGAKVAIACFDQTVDTVFEGSPSAFGEAEKGKIRARQALGASDLEQALRWAGQHSMPSGIRRVIVITDGVATAGETKESRLRQEVSALGSAGIQRLDAVAIGGLRDDAMLRGLVTSGLAHDGVVAEAEDDLAAIERKLTRSTKSGIAVQVEGATWSWPARLDGVQPGDEALVYTDVMEGQPVRVKLGNEPVQAYQLASVDRPLVERAWARARIESLLERERAEGSREDFANEIVSLSTRHRVLSPYTSMLVLETEADYERFKIDRRALSDILVVKDAAVVSMHRDPFDSKRRAAQIAGDSPVASSAPSRPGAAPAPTQPPRVVTAPPSAGPSDSIGESFGAGGLGLVGIGEGGGGLGEGIGLGNIGTLGHGAGTGTGQGFGSGHGRLGGSHRTTNAPQVRMGATTVSGRLPPEVIQRIVRQNFGRFRLCYENGLRANPNLQGRVAVRFVIDRAGAVSSVTNAGSDLPDQGVVSCVVRSFHGLSFPQPEGGIVTVYYPILFSPGGGPVTPGRPPAPEKPVVADPYTGKFKELMAAIASGHADKAIERAHEWRASAAGDVLSYIALGEAAEAKTDWVLAARAYGSVIDLFPARADLRRFAGERLERVRDAQAQRLALDSFAKAKEQRPDHPSSYRLLAFAQLRAGEHEKAFATLVEAVGRHYPAGRFAGVDRILREDLGLVAAAWMKADPKQGDAILDRLKKAGGTVENAPSIRFVLNWETDANDVDFHIYDDKGGHAWYSKKQLASGGELYADVMTGYGPECFTIRKPKAQRAGTYTLQANYYARGPMGYGMGKLEVIDHDGKGGLVFEQHPYVVMVDRGFVDLGVIKK